jgi:putative membrane protein
MRLIRILLAFLCIAFGIGVVALNAEAVHLDLLWIEFSLPLGLLLLSVLLLGALLGGMAALLSRGESTPAAPVEDDEASAG